MPTKGLRKVDLHLHTVFSNFRHLKILRARDSYNDPLKVYERCRALGMDYVAITDHDTLDGALDLLARRPDLEPTVIVGEEVETWFPETGQWIHVNVFGLDEAAHRDITHLRPDVRELVGWLRAKGLPHVLNHPLQSYRLQRAPMKYVEEVLSLFTHVEVGNATLPVAQNRTVSRMVEYGRRRGLPSVGVGGSDAHGLGTLGSYVTVAAGDTKGEWLASVKEGRCAAAGKEIGFTGMLGEVYAIVGRYYQRLGTQEGRREMGAVNYAAAAGFVPACLLGVPLAFNVLSFVGTTGLSGLVHLGLQGAEREALREAVSEETRG
ncbi:MAG: PHP domain-containing protein [Acidobacteria bacterium]|nr:PHP domain-containing protein [Acidobacteriota bacterium]